MFKFYIQCYGSNTIKTLNKWDAMKRQSTRLRKKLRVGEFQELGFSYETKLIKPLIREDESKLLDDLIAVIEANNLAVGGGVTSGFVTTFKRGSVTEKQRLIIKDWLDARGEFTSVSLSELVDAYD